MYEEPNQPAGQPVKQQATQPIDVSQTAEQMQEQQAVSNKAQQVANVQNAEGANGVPKVWKVAPAADQNTGSEPAQEATQGVEPEANPLFETSERTLTTGKNKGKKSYSAKLTRKLKKGEGSLSDLKKKAKAHNGKWNQRLGGFNFDTAADRDAFVNDTDNGGGGQSAQKQDEAKSQNLTQENEKVIVTGDEFGNYNDLKDLRKKAMDYYKNTLQGTTVENEELGRIDIDNIGLVEFTTEGRKKVQTNSANPVTLLLVKHLPELIRGAKKVEHKVAESEKHKERGDSFYYLDTSYVMDGKEIPVRVTVKKLNDGDLHFFNVLTDSKKEDTSVSPRTESSNEANVSKAVDVSSSTFSIPQEGQKAQEELGKIGNPINGRNGKNVTVYTDDGTAVQTRYMLVPQSKVITSSRYEGVAVVRNDEYPSELQPRDRDRVAMRLQTDRISNEIRI